MFPFLGFYNDCLKFTICWNCTPVLLFPLPCLITWWWCKQNLSMPEIHLLATASGLASLSCPYLLCLSISYRKLVGGADLVKDTAHLSKLGSKDSKACWLTDWHSHTTVHIIYSAWLKHCAVSFICHVGLSLTVTLKNLWIHSSTGFGSSQWISQPVWLRYLKDDPVPL